MSTYGTYSSSGFNTLSQINVWSIISIVIAIIGGIFIYYTVLTKDNEKKCTGFMKWLFNFATFKKLILEDIIKVLYIIVALYITLSSFGLISSGFALFLAQLIFGNILARIIFEFSLLMITICKNTTEINEKLSLKEDNKNKKEEKSKEK